MINRLVEWFMRVVDKVMGRLARTIPTLEDDGGICDAMSGISSTLSSVTWFVPAFALQISFVMLMSVLIPFVALQLVRIIASFATGGGGST